jgi:PIN domain nuclease of toxin-antitoxin system
MNLLLDTHALLWFLWDDPQLSRVAKSVMVDPANRKFVSAASCWETAIKVSLGKLRLGEPTSTFFARELPRNHFELVSVRLDHACAVETLPFHHRDPFDRLIVAQALMERMVLVSADLVLDAYGVNRVW